MSSTLRFTLSVHRHSQRADQDHPEMVSQDGDERTYHYSCEFDPSSSEPSRSNKCAPSLEPTTPPWPAGSRSPPASAWGGPRSGPEGTPGLEPQVMHRQGPLSLGLGFLRDRNLPPPTHRRIGWWNPQTRPPMREAVWIVLYIHKTRITCCI
jgi:hypothetical protein